MGAKVYGMVLAAAALGGCSQLELERFAPPGIVKYENLAGDEPASPEIQARIDEYNARDGGGYPKLSELDFKRPDGLSAKEREAEQARLRAERAEVEASVIDDRLAAQSERSDGVTLPGDRAAAKKSLEEARAALADAIEAAEREAARERREMPPMPAAAVNEDDE